MPFILWFSFFCSFPFHQCNFGYLNMFGWWTHSSVATSLDSIRSARESNRPLSTTFTATLSANGNWCWMFHVFLYAKDTVISGLPDAGFSSQLQWDCHVCVWFWVAGDYTHTQTHTHRGNIKLIGPRERQMKMLVDDQVCTRNLIDMNRYNLPLVIWCTASLTREKFPRPMSPQNRYSPTLLPNATYNVQFILISDQFICWHTFLVGIKRKKRWK